MALLNENSEFDCSWVKLFYVLPSIARITRGKVPCFVETFSHFLEFALLRE